MTSEVRVDGSGNRSVRALLLGLGLVVAVSATRALGLALMRRWWGMADFEPSWRGAAFLLALIGVVSVGIVGGGLFGLAGVSWEELGWRRQRLAREVGRGLLGALILALITGVFAFVGMKFLGLKPPPSAATASGVTAVGLLMSVSFGFLIAAWSEENVFRGYLQPLLAARYGLLSAILLQAALFSLAHIGCNQEWPFFILWFVTGAILGWLRGRDGSLVAPFVAHGLVG
jgi:membrane protease YdiL (CAAX protease family)